MLDITKLNKETFAVKTHNGVLHLYQPKVKSVKRLTGILKNIQASGGEASVEDLDEIFEVFENIINKNKEKRKISKEDIENKYDITDIILILNGFFEWFNEVSNSKN